MITLKGPGIFLAQFAGDEPPFNSLETIAEWAASLGYKGIQIPTTDDRLFDLAEAARSKGYCDDVAGMLSEHGLRVTELSTHLQGQLVAVHPAYDQYFDGFAPAAVRGLLLLGLENVEQRVTSGDTAGVRTDDDAFGDR